MIGPMALKPSPIYGMLYFQGIHPGPRGWIHFMEREIGFIRARNAILTISHLKYDRRDAAR
jgi:hypothetical protein